MLSNSKVQYTKNMLNSRQDEKESIISYWTECDEEESISYWTECDGKFTFHRDEDGKLDIYIEL